MLLSAASNRPAARRLGGAAQRRPGRRLAADDDVAMLVDLRHLVARDGAQQLLHRADHRLQPLLEELLRLLHSAVEALSRRGLAVGRSAGGMPRRRQEQAGEKKGGKEAPHQGHGVAHSSRSSGAGLAPSALQVPAKPSTRVMMVAMRAVLKTAPGRKIQELRMIRVRSSQAARVPAAPAIVAVTRPRRPYSRRKARPTSRRVAPSTFKTTAS